MDRGQKSTHPKTQVITMKGTLTLVLASIFTFQAWSLEIGSKVENFRLLDHYGEEHELHNYEDKKAIVFFVQGNGCPIVRNAMPRYNELATSYKDKDIQFLSINSNLQDNRKSIHEEAIRFGYRTPILIDNTQIIGKSLGLVRTAEVFVLAPKTWEIVYHGALDDRLTYENQKAEASNHYLKDAIDSMLNEKNIKIAKTDAVGCLINFPIKRNLLP